MRAFLLTCALLALLPASAFAGEVVVVGGEGSRVVDNPLLPSVEATDPTSAAVRCRAVPAAPARVRKAAGGPTVKDALTAARKDGSIGTADYARYRDAYSAARKTVGGLSGQRRTELNSVINTLELIASRKQLTGSRMPALFLTLRRNTEFWPKRPFPLTPPPPAGQKKPCAGDSGQGGARVEFEGDPVVFQYYRGKGLQLQQLANFAKANGLYQRCKDTTPDPEKPCNRDALRTLLDRLLEISAKRAGATTWEYYFEFGGGQPPWASGLAQGTAVQALARGYELLGEERYKTTGHDALGIFQMKPPAGVAVPSAGVSHYLIYSMSPGLRVLNGFLQGVTGLYDFAELTGDKDARRLFQKGDRAARAEIPRYDTGKWSLYNMNGRESDLGYHRLVRDFLENLCKRTSTSIYCKTAKKFTAYQHQRVKLIVNPVKRARVKKPVALTFSVSKISCTQLTVIRNPAPPAPAPEPEPTTPPPPADPPPGVDIAGAPQSVFAKQQVLGGGGHRVTWTPPRRGKYLVRVVAIDLNNHKKTVEQRFEVR